ncbi:MAG: hypothetical protein ACK5PF_06425, partial [bacterium]
MQSIGEVRVNPLFETQLGDMLRSPGADGYSASGIPPAGEARTFLIDVLNRIDGRDLFHQWYGYNSNDNALVSPAQRAALRRYQNSSGQLGQLLAAGWNNLDDAITAASTYYDKHIYRDGLPVEGNMFFYQGGGDGKWRLTLPSVGMRSAVSLQPTQFNGLALGRWIDSLRKTAPGLLSPELRISSQGLFKDWFSLHFHPENAGSPHFSQADLRAALRPLYAPRGQFGVWQDGLAAVLDASKFKLQLDQYKSAPGGFPSQEEYEKLQKRYVSLRPVVRTRDSAPSTIALANEQGADLFVTTMQAGGGIQPGDMLRSPGA